MSFSVFRVPVLIGSVAISVSCFSATEPVEILTWDGTLVASDGIVDGMAGSIAMVIGDGQTQVGVSVRLAPAGESLGWALRDGTCSGSGARVGPATAFPAITVDNDGEGASETTLFRRIDTAGPYALVVYENEDGTGDVLACGDFERT